MSRGTGGLFSRLIYYVLFFLILILPVWIYFSWLQSYRLSHPRIIEAAAAGYVEEQPLEGILLWDEQLVYAPQDGVFTYPSPQPRRVAKGETIAALDGFAVRAPYPGYFYPALDGQEGHWVYSRLWPDFAPFPFFKPAVPLGNGIPLRKGDPIGKMVPQPQTLRCITYLDSTPSLERGLKARNAVIRIKMEPDGKERRAEVVAFKASKPVGGASQGNSPSSGRNLEGDGDRIKVYLRLPFFPPSLLRSRSFSARVVTENQRGVMVPDSAVVTREGKNVAFILQGNQILQRDVEGFPAGVGNFFIVKGVEPGNKLILDAGNVQGQSQVIW